MEEILTEEKTVWQRLQEEKRPIALYGMGDGADKIMAVFQEHGITVREVFASDDFVRGHSFHGYRVKSRSEILKEYEDPVIVLAFASQRPEILQRFWELERQYTVYAPDVPVAGTGLFDLSFYSRHKEAIREAYGLLADERSRAVFRDIVNFKISGKISYLRRCETEKEEIFSRHFFLQNDEIFLDLGAYNGDTIRELLEYTGGQYQKIIALEPDRKNFRKLSNYVEQAGLCNVALYQMGAWKEKGTLCFAAKAGRNSALKKADGEKIGVSSVDAILEGQPVSYIKMDVEGAEKEALEGAAFTLSAYHPKLNIALYHRNEDLFAIPLQIQKITKKYSFYLRHHPYVPAWEVNLYAVPK